MRVAPLHPRPPEENGISKAVKSHPKAAFAAAALLTASIMTATATCVSVKPKTVSFILPHSIASASAESDPECMFTTGCAFFNLSSGKRSFNFHVIYGDPFNGGSMRLVIPDGKSNGYKAIEINTHEKNAEFESYDPSIPGRRKTRRFP